MSKSSVVSCDRCRDVRISCQLDGTRCRSHVELNPTSKNQVLASSPPITQAIYNPTSLDAVDTLSCCQHILSKSSSLHRLVNQTKSTFGALAEWLSRMTRNHIPSGAQVRVLQASCSKNILFAFLWWCEPQRHYFCARIGIGIGTIEHPSVGMLHLVPSSVTSCVARFD
jgi:hypothetical protein